MLKSFYPDEYVESAYKIPYEQLYKKGWRGVIFDVDNTLVPHGYPPDECAERLFERLRAIGFETCILSNNKEERVAPFANQVGSLYIHKAGKPSKKGYLQAMQAMGSKCSDTLLVGDQIFTDVWGANRTGIHSILVKPIDPREEIQIILKRIPETVVLFFYRRQLAKGKKNPSRADSQ